MNEVLPESSVLKPTHACLTVDEIIRTIAEELVDLEAMATAVALASSCKTLEDPVLEELWRAQDRLLPLLKSFPSDAWKIERGRFCFSRIPTKAEWNRFRKYARWMDDLVVDASQDLISSEALPVLQLRVGNGSLLPGLESFTCERANKAFIPFIPLLLSEQTAFIDITFAGTPPTVTVASTIARFPTLCPNIQRLALCHLPTNPVVTEAVSEMVLACNRDTLQEFYVESPLTEEAHKVLYNLPKLSVLLAVLLGPTSIPPIVLPDLDWLRIEYDHGSDWSQIFHRATIGKLEAVTFVPSGSAQIDGLLEKFQRVALSTKDTLSNFYIRTSRPWSPNYSSMLTFTQLKTLRIDFSCHNGCSSQVDDGIVVSIARAMPGLESLLLGSAPCSNPTGITLEGLVTLAHHCSQLSVLCVHLHVEELAEATTRGEPLPSSERKVTIPRTDCALTDLLVGETPIPPQAAWTVSLTLLQLFPQIHDIKYTNPQWKSVAESIVLFKKIGDQIHQKRNAFT